LPNPDSHRQELPSFLGAHSFIISPFFSTRITLRYFKVIPYNTKFSKKLLFAFLPLKPRVFSLFLFYI